MRSAYGRDVKGQDKTKVFDDSYASARNEISLVTSVGKRQAVGVHNMYVFLLFSHKI